MMTGAESAANEQNNGRADPFEVDEDPIPLPPVVEQGSLAFVEDGVRRMLVQIGTLQNERDAAQRAAQRGQRDQLLALLDIVDAFDRILRPGGSTDDPRQALDRLRSNVEMTRRKFLQVLERSGVRRMELRGKVVDPNLADVEAVRERGDLPAETVLDEIAAGYWVDQSILRRAKVIVSDPQADGLNR
jgi:molecular chaperone GrpE